MDRIIFQNWVVQDSLSGEMKHQMSIELHGDATVYEAEVAQKYDHSDVPGLTPEMAAMLKKDKAEHPEQYIPQHISSNAYKLTIATNESDRVQRAWKYIYAHGCTGTKSSF
ncbi:hypothetical protein C7S15_7940 [Burkholderia cepacia]|nr:hypothetical protein [Burkholderia cepacia]